MIVVRGGSIADEDGFPTAHNQSMFFAWLDRRGFTYGNEELAIPVLQDIARRGGRYWIAETSELRGAMSCRGGEELPPPDACDPDYVLYDLGAPQAEGAR